MTMNDSVISDVLVFKTSIHSENDIRKIAPVLNHDLRIRKWNVDHQDIDHILRVESEHTDPSYVIQLINKAGFVCEELPD